MVERKLNIGAGMDLLEGFDNLDYHDEAWKKYVADDANYGKTIKFIKHKLPAKMPMADNTYDYVYCSHLLEDFNNEDFFKIMADIHRVTKKGGIVEIRVPMFGYPGAVMCVQHQRFFHKASFNWFAKDQGSTENYSECDALFDKMISTKIVTRESWLSHYASWLYVKLFSKRADVARPSFRAKRGFEWQMYKLLNHVGFAYDKELNIKLQK